MQQPSSSPLTNLRPGPPPGNLNNFKHGRYSKQLRAHREHVRALNELTTGSSRPNVLEYAVALRWSRQDRAVLEIAVAKMAFVVHHHIALADALAVGEEPPPPPDVHVSRIEHFVYKRYVDQRRSLTGGTLAGEDDAPTEAARVARQMLSDWILAADVLGPEAPAAFGLADPAERMGVGGSTGSTNSAGSTGSTGSMDSIPATSVPEEAA